MEFFPDAERFMYNWNMRELTSIFQGVCLAKPEFVNAPMKMFRLWAHETYRVFGDRLVNLADFDKFDGKMRGISDPASAAAKPIVEYTWTKLWNAKAYNACSGMPRFGHAGLLDETQLKHLMALILDPKSPVNQ